VLNAIDCTAIQVGGVADHVHLFFGLARTRTVAEVVEKTKTSSSKWIKTRKAGLASFHWQAGYGAFSVSQSDAQAVVDYIQKQPKHQTNFVSGRVPPVSPAISSPLRRKVRLGLTFIAARCAALFLRRVSQPNGLG
jgi:hypothetical protein